MFKKKNTIAILGVDGSGKSTAVENVAKRYGDRCSVTYMGFTRFEDPRIESSETRRFSRPLRLYLIYRCFWKRYKKAVSIGQFALFDRYVHEIFINSRGGWYNNINVLLYKYFFPQPQIIVYLYCPAEESLRRKSDIPDPDKFIEMKERFDNFFLNKKHVMCIDSGKLSPDLIADKICAYIDQSFSK